MRSRLLKGLAALVLVLSMMAGYALSISAEGEMAYNFYSEPQFEGEMAYTTYAIDMRADLTPDATYWSLANFAMYISDKTKAEYPNLNVKTGGAYAGLQHAGNQRKAIMAFWEWHYWPDGPKPSAPIGKHEDGTDDWGETNLVAERIYPELKPGEGTFGGEGEGSNYIGPYPWQTSQWYRMVLHTWDDPIRGTTYCGQWVQDLSTGKYTLICYFDTKMRDSYLVGNMHFFMENFYGYNLDQERDVKLKNIYAKQMVKNDDGSVDWVWTSINSSNLSHCGNWANNKIGAHSFGATEEYFWGKTGGFADMEGQTQAEHDAAWPEKVYTISQPDQPTFGDLKFKKIQLINKGGQWTAKWTMANGSTPQLTYALEVKDGSGKVLYSEKTTAPEVFYKALEGVQTDEFVCKVTITDIFGDTKWYAQATDKYIEKYGEPENKYTLHEDQKVIVDDDEGNLPETDDKKDSGSMGLIIGVSAAAVVVVIGAVGAVLVIKKKKKK